MIALICAMAALGVWCCCRMAAREYERSGMK